MKFTLNWLKEHLDTDKSLNEITDKLTALGLELEGVEDPGKIYAPFKAAHVVSAEQHPDADRLRVCIVDTGSEKIQVVCGAPNAKAGMKAIFAPNGAYIPGTDMTLKKGKIRGQDSNGMLVSEREMGLSDEHNGIIELPQDTPIGTAFTELFNLNDPIIDIALTPDRSDCAGVRGIARDLAAAGMGTLKPLDTVAIQGKGKSPIGVTITSTQQCPMFLGRLIKNIQNEQSPAWMQSRLKAIGLRPISALVDITNYVTHDLCRPLHVYDADLLKGGINVRLSTKGESFDALNDKSYMLDEGMCVITDQSGVLGLGGIVGGVSTGCTETTQNVFLECAYFDPYAIARTGRALQIDSDARYRFERGVDTEFLPHAIEIATRLVMEICGTDKTEVMEVVTAGQAPDIKKQITFEPSTTKKLVGMDVPEDTQKEILKKLGFEINGNMVTTPSWRHDVEGKADLVEEVIRVIGYDKIEPVSVRSTNTVFAGAETPHLTSVRLSRAALSARGLNECVTFSFMPRSLAAHFTKDNCNDNALTLTNPISADLDQMRPSILGNLIAAAAANSDKGNGDVKLFEVGPVYPSAKPDGQRTVATGIRFGSLGNRHWEGVPASRKNDVYDVKADAIATIEAVGFGTGSLQTAREASNYFHPGRSGVLMMGNKPLAQFGEIHPAILDDMGIKASVMGFEVFLNNIPPSKKKSASKSLLQVSAFQPLSRDFAFIVDENVEAENIIRAAKAADRNLIHDATIFDVYQGKGVELGKKSVAINVVIQPVKATLTDSEIDGLSTKIIDAVASKTGATLRG